MMKERNIYLDYAASTPVDERILDAMMPYFREKYGNPNAIHSFGQEALAAIDGAKETIARALGAEREELYFAPSASAANKLALEETVRRAADTVTVGGKLNIVVSAIEHDSIREVAQALEERGIAVREAPVTEEGIVDLAALGKLIDERTVLVSVMYVNNEIGTVEPLADIAKLIAGIRRRTNSRYPLFHTDASHGPQYLSCDVDELGIDLMTLCAHKLCGPKGIGALYARGGGIRPELHRATANVPSIVGFAEAVKLAVATREEENERMRELLKYVMQGVRQAYGRAVCNGVADADSPRRAPHIVSFSFPGKSGDELLIKLDMAGVAVSAGAACTARAIEPSHVIQALGYDRDRAKSTLRFSFGRWTTRDELDEALARLKKVL